MKKLTLFLCSVFFLVMSSCNKNNDTTSVSSYAKITVEHNGEAKSGVTVYMFDSSASTVTGFSPDLAKKSVVTEANGVATFNLEETFDLNIIDTQTTLYFAVFNGEHLLGKTALTIEKKQTKSATINY